jgi:hypothetical protein
MVLAALARALVMTALRRRPPATYRSIIPEVRCRSGAPRGVKAARSGLGGNAGRPIARQPSSRAGTPGSRLVSAMWKESRPWMNTGELGSAMSCGTAGRHRVSAAPPGSTSAERPARARSASAAPVLTVSDRSAPRRRVPLGLVPARSDSALELFEPALPPAPDARCAAVSHLLTAVHAQGLSGAWPVRRSAAAYSNCRSILVERHTAPTCSASGGCAGTPSLFRRGSCAASGGV